MSLFAVRGVYENCVVHPLEPLPDISQSQVIITFLSSESADDFETSCRRYIAAATENADYQKLRVKSYAGTIPDCTGVVAFGQTLAECQRELVSVLYDWILVKRQRNISIPVINGINLNEAKDGSKMATL